jgi:hypothetical protein
VAGFWFEIGDPFLDHGYAGVDVVKGFSLGGGGFGLGGLVGGSAAEF